MDKIIWTSIELFCLAAMMIATFLFGAAVWFKLAPSHHDFVFFYGPLIVLGFVFLTFSIPWIRKKVRKNYQATSS